MAKELIVRTGLSLQTGTYTAHVPNAAGIATQRVDVSGTEVQRKTQSVTETEAALEIEPATRGWAYLRNASATAGDVMHVRGGSGETDLLTLKPGEGFPLRLHASAAPWVIADAGKTVPLDYWIFPD